MAETFTIPITPSGKSSVAAGPPWFFGADVIHVEYHVDEEQFLPFLPPFLEIDPMDPARVQLAFCNMSAVSLQNSQQYYLTPNDVNFNECLIKLRVRAGSASGWFVSHSWVTNDVSLVRGFIQGFPKRLGNVAMTKFDTLQERTGGRRPNAKLGAVLETPDGLRVRIMHVCSQVAGAESIPALPFFLRRHYPSLTPPYHPVVDEIVSPIVEDSEDTEVWIGEAELEASGTACDPMPLLKPIDAPASRSFRSKSVISGAKVIHRIRV